MTHHQPTYQYKYKYKYPPIDASSPSPSCIPPHTSLCPSNPASISKNFDDTTFDYFVDALYKWTVTKPTGNVCGHDLRGYPLERSQKNQILKMRVDHVYTAKTDNYNFTMNRQKGNDRITIKVKIESFGFYPTYWDIIPIPAYPNLDELYKLAIYFSDLCRVPPPSKKPDFKKLILGMVAEIAHRWIQEPVG
jgi:hypothetical protein